MTQDKKSTAIIVATVIALALFAAAMWHDMYRNKMSRLRVAAQSKPAPIVTAPTQIVTPTPAQQPSAPIVREDVITNKSVSTSSAAVYTNEAQKIQFTYPTGAVVRELSARNVVLVTRIKDLAMQVNRYSSLAQLGNYTSLDEYFKNRESQNQISNRAKTTLNGQVAYKYTDNGLVSVFTVLVQHPDGSIHIITFPLHEIRTQLSAAEVALLLSIMFLK